ncbi:NAD(P)/FAD-dependent oxidoreductase [Candidatus Bathyarchaeota archaeon]|nr:NAD(P)/FAD-dependent oxidoreductase [Candidatus Bathyarchaeota archaeon]
MNDKERKIVIVGAGISGLTAAAYLSRKGCNVLLIEKNDKCGGLLNSFKRQGFVFDVGARSIENSGVIRPMLRNLGIELELFESPVSIGIEDKIINILSGEQLSDYKELLEYLYPDSKKDIDKIIRFIERILKDMKVLYGIDNPFFLNLKNNRLFLIKELLPWFLRFVFVIRRINRMQEPVESFLEKMSSNASLIDIISQHFFKNTPVFFALGYFYVYIDYLYPKGGTGQLPKAIEQKIVEWGGKILTETEITKVVPSEKELYDANGDVYSYDNLIWSADLKTLYNILETANLNSNNVPKILEQKEEFQSKRGGDSVFSVMIGVDEPPEKFKSISNGHFFYTPSKKGLGETHRSRLKSLIENFERIPKEEVLEWVDDYCRLTTYEISIPALRDPSLAPKGKTGLIVSFLFEYDLIKKVEEAGWYEEFKKEVENRILKTLDNSIYPRIEEKILFRFSSTPLTISKMAGTSEGGIVGWSYETSVPVVNNLRKMPDSIKTPIPDALQTGQWVYSPAGIPTAVLTGWLAARSIMENSHSGS